MKHGLMVVLAAGMAIGLAACSSSDDDADRTGGATDAPGLAVEAVGRYQVAPFAFGEGAAEIVVHDPAAQLLFVVNSQANTVDVLDIANPANPMRVDRIDATAEGASANSVAIFEGTVAVAIEADDAQAPGKVVFYADDNGDMMFDKRGEAPVGALPDMLTFTPDGTRVLVANEGEPSDDYTIDPEGSISVIEVGDGFVDPAVVTLDFSAFNDRADALREVGVRIFGPGASVAQDLEPEYIAVALGGTRAYASLQENNAIAVIDLDALAITDVLPLGTKDHGIEGQGLDPSNEDGFNVRPVPVLGLYQPDTIAAFEIDGARYLLTANEGDARDYDAFSEEADVKDLALDPATFANIEALQSGAELGDLQVTNTLGRTAPTDSDGEPVYDALYAFGARSFSIRRADTAELVYDSADDFERITGERYGGDFNNDNTENSGDSRSDNKGPEPEAIAYGEIEGRRYAFIGLERMGGFFVYDITDVRAPRYLDYVNNRDLTVDPESGTAGDLGPESIVFIRAEDSPIENVPMLAVGNEISGSTSLYRLDVE